MAPIASRVAELNGEALSPYSPRQRTRKAWPLHIHLELASPFHPAPRVDALRSAVAAGRDRYVSPRGIPALREAVAEYLLRHTQRGRCTRASPDRARLQNGPLARHDALIEPATKSSIPIPASYLSVFCAWPGRQSRSLFSGRENQFQPDLRELPRKFAAHQSSDFQFANNPPGQFSADATLAQIAALAPSTTFGSLPTEIYARILFSGAYKSICLRKPSMRTGAHRHLGRQVDCTRR